jgi:pyrroline-5-carboxylate reductase
MHKIGFIGTGTMGSAIIKGIVLKGLLPASEIMIYDKDSLKSAELSLKTGVTTAGDLNELCAYSEYIFLCIKPNVFDFVLTDIKDHLKKGTVLISIAAGVTTERIKSFIGDGYDIVRTMPNTPLLVGEGMTVICENNAIDADKFEYIKRIFSSMGRIHVLPERLMSDVIALTGSSPAYVYMFIEALSKGAQESGIDKKTAYILGAQAVLGAAKMVIETGEDPVKLRNDVCSPGGTTIEAVKKLEEGGFETTIMEAMKACTAKAYRLGGK